MNNRFLTGDALPFCKGCSHTTISDSTEKALQKLGLNPLDVILVTDIGCHGIIDKAFLTHTVHGLHGRSVALGAGISAGINDPSKKVIVFVGDGGATIGMQHLIDAAHRGFNMTVVIHNNFLYGMTGGQPSEFTPQGFKTPTLPGGAIEKGYDICALMTAAGASYVRRINAIGDISDQLAEAFSRKGFSVVEVMEICTSYGVKSNPGMKLSKLVEDAGFDIKVFTDHAEKIYKTNFKTEAPSLINEKNEVNINHSSNITRSLHITLCGSAGEGTQAAAEFLARAGIMSGLHVTKKGSYPVTVGVGFSSADLILSPEEILYTGSATPDIMVITSQDGLDYGKNLARAMQGGIMFIDSSLSVPETGAEVIQHDFRNKLGARNSALYSLFFLVNKLEIVPMEAMKDTFAESKFSMKQKVENLMNFD